MPNIRVNRSQTTQYNPYTDCLYCAESIPRFRNCSKETPENYDLKYSCKDVHCIEQNSVAQATLERARERGDKWGEEIEYRLLPLLGNGDLVAIEAKYHHECQVI